MPASITVRIRVRRFLAVCAALLCLAGSRAAAQAVDSTLQSADSLRTVASPMTVDDTLRMDDSVRTTTDTTLRFDTKNSADTIVSYAAKDSVVYRLSEKKMRMSGDAQIAYGATAVKSARITIDWDASTIHAQGIADSSGRLAGTPEFKEGGSTYKGQEMTYNFRSKRGVITEGQTAIDDGFYLGERIKRMGEDCYFIQDGRYTTCDNAEHKHYHFGSPRMKLIPNDVIVAEPIVFYVEDIPLFALPFAVIPSKSGGRTSGIIIPTFGSDYARGRYFKGGGYYLAASDYWDARLTGDWWSKGGYQVNGFVQYALRYSFSGSVSASYGRTQYLIGNPFVPDDQPRTEYKFALTHNQTLDPLSRITVDFSFLSNTYYDAYSNNFNELLRQNSRSTANYSTSWEGTGRSLNINVSRDQDLRNGTATNTLPDISFSQAQFFPFRGSASTGNEAWYEMIGFTYGARARHDLNTTKLPVYRPGIDTTDRIALFSRRGIQHNVSLNYTPKLGYVTIQPTFSYTERWYDHLTERFWQESDSTVRARDVSVFSALRTFSMGVSMNTKLYGMLAPNVFGIQGIRHTLQPSLSYSYNPDFSKEAWGYHRSFRMKGDSLVRYDPYSGYTERADEVIPGEVYGGISRGESQTLGMNLSNIVEMKLNPAEGDTTLTPRKFQLFNLNASTSYNFVRDSLRLSPFSLSLRTAIGSVLDVYGGASFTPYVWQPAVYGYDSTGALVQRRRGYEIDRYVWQDGFALGRLTSFDIHFSTNLSSEMFESARDTSMRAGEMGAEQMAAEQMGQARAYDFRMKWNLSLGYDYTMSQLDPENKSRSSSMRASLTFQPTPGWNISASTYYDFVTRQVGAPQIAVTRDLHCWEMLFTWVPTGFNRNFSLVIRLRAPQLQDIKLERKGSDRGVY